MPRCVLGALSLGLALSQPLVGQGTPTTAPSVPTVAVLDFSAFSLLPGEDAASVGRGLTAMIATELASRPAVRVVDRQRVDELIAKRELGLSGRLDEAQAVRLGQLLGAQYVVVGNVALEPGRARIDLRLLDVATGVIERAERRQGSRDEFLELVTRIADAFTKDLPAPAGSAPAELAIPAGAALAYSRGLDYERRGRAERAAAMYREALSLFPQHEAASAGLRRVSGRGGSQ